MVPDKIRPAVLCQEPFADPQFPPDIRGHCDTAGQGGNRTQDGKPQAGPGFFLFSQEDLDDDIDNEEQDRREQPHEKIIVQDPALGALQRGLQLENDLVDVDLPPLCESPAGTEADHSCQKQQDPRQNKSGVFQNLFYHKKYLCAFTGNSIKSKTVVQV